MTYEELCSFEVLYKAYLEARKGKRSKSKTIEYEAQALACTEKLSRKLAVCNVRQPDGSIRQQIRYVPSKFEVFAVYEPKRRMVHAPAFVDKVVLHALVDNILYDALTKSFIRDSHASQTGKGTDDGLMRLKTHMVDYYRREGHGADGWVLKGDVRHFFASIDHRKLKRKLKAVLDKRGVDPREADPDMLPAELFVTAVADGEIMAVEHKKYPVYGLQFHPESILTPKGIDILRNVVESTRK